MSGQVAAARASSERFDERRQWGRFVVDVGKLIVSLTPTEQRSAEVVDESFGGIGIVIDNASGLQPGRDLSLAYDGVPMRGTVRSVHPHGGGRYRVGIEWLSSQPFDPGSHDAKAQIRGRLRVLFRTWEGGRWNELARAVACLKREAEAMQLETIAHHATALLAMLDDLPLNTTTPEPLIALVDACLDTEDVTVLSE
jgi:hypothetical protein